MHPCSIYTTFPTLLQVLFRGSERGEKKENSDIQGVQGGANESTVSATTANSTGAPPRSPAPVSTEDRSGVGGSSDGQDEQK